MSLVLTTIMIYSIYEFTRVIVAPYEHRKLAENNDTLRTAWFFLVVGALCNSAINIKAFKIMRPMLEQSQNLRLLVIIMIVPWTIGPLVRQAAKQPP